MHAQWPRPRPQAGWCHDLVLRQLFTLKKLGRFEAAMALAEAEMPRWSESPDFFFTLGDLLLDWAAARPQQAASLLPMIESSWLRALDIGENPTLQDTVQGRGSFLAAHNLAVMFDALGDAAKARHWRERAAWLRRSPPPHARQPYPSRHEPDPAAALRSHEQALAAPAFWPFKSSPAP